MTRRRGPGNGMPAGGGGVLAAPASWRPCPAPAGGRARRGGRLAAFRDRLGAGRGRDVYLLSFWVAPQTATPARLKRYAERVGARPGWFFLTGSKTNVDWALYKLGAYTEPAEAHSNLLILGNEPAGEWKKVFGLAPAEDLLRSLDAVSRRGRPEGSSLGGAAKGGTAPA